MGKGRFAARAAGVWRSTTSHPVEFLVLLHAMLAISVDGDKVWQHLVIYSPFAVVAALSLWFHRAKRWTLWAYWAVLPLYALCALLPLHFIDTPEMFILNAMLVPAYLLARRGGDFSMRLFGMVRSLAVSLGVGLLACMLLMLIQESIWTLFDAELFSSEIMIYFSMVLLAPMVFVGMESSGAEIKASKLEEALVNWVLTIALLIYNAVLYIYLLSIVYQWELPEGSVATMVSLFMLALMGIRWLRPMLARQPFEWYFRWSGLLALPLVALFWVAVGYRIGQYGLTLDRCTLLAAGVGMTVYAVMSSFRPRRGGYAFMALTLAMGLLVVFSGRSASMLSQASIVRHNAAKAGVMVDGGILRFTDMDADDADHRAEHRRAYQAMEYMEQSLRDKEAVKRRLGMTSSQYLDHLSRKTAIYAESRSVDDYCDAADEEVFERPAEFLVGLHNNNLMIDPSGYNRLYCNIDFSGGRIWIGDTSLVCDSILAVQLAKIGYSLDSHLDSDEIYDNQEKLCTYRSPDGRTFIVFRTFSIISQSDGNHMKDGYVQCALFK